MDDEDVLFEGSPLHGHLKEAGCGGIVFEKRTKNSSTESSMENESSEKNNITTSEKKHESQGWWAYVKEQVHNYIYDESWKTQITSLHKRTSDKIVSSSLNQPILSSEDASYVETFFFSLDKGSSSKSDSSSSAIYGYIFLQISVLIVTISYGLMRMFYIKTSQASSPMHSVPPGSFHSPPHSINPTPNHHSTPLHSPPSTSTSSCVYGLDVLSLLVTIAALLPASLKFSATGKVVAHLSRLEQMSSNLSSQLQAFSKLSNRAVLFVQESEVISRGFTLLTVPISRLEQGLNPRLDARHCIDLRRSIYYRNRRILLAIRSTTMSIIKLLPPFVELKGVKECLAAVDLNNFCDFVKLAPKEGVEDDAATDEDCASEEEVSRLTDGYSLAAIKYLSNMTQAHCSDFLRVVCLYCCIRADHMHKTNEDPSVLGFKHLHDLLSGLLKVLQQQTPHLKLCLDVNKTMRNRAASASAAGAGRGGERGGDGGGKGETERREAHMLVHSLFLHLQAALNKVINHDEAFESGAATIDHVKAVAGDLPHLHKELSACKDCLQRLDVFLHSFDNKDSRALDNKTDKQTDTKTLNETHEQQHILVSADSIPTVQDEVFEGMTLSKRDMREEGAEALDEANGGGGKNMAEVLSELQWVISERAVQMAEREKRAMARTNAGQAVASLTNGPVNGSTLVSNKEDADRKEQEEEENEGEGDKMLLGSPRLLCGKNCVEAPSSGASAGIALKAPQGASKTLPEEASRVENDNSLLDHSTSPLSTSFLPHGLPPHNDGARPKEYRQYYGKFEKDSSESGTSSSSSSSSSFVRNDRRYINATRVRRRKNFPSTVFPVYYSKEGKLHPNVLAGHPSTNPVPSLPLGNSYQGGDVVKDMAKMAAALGRSHPNKQEEIFYDDDYEIRSDDDEVNYEDDEEDEEDEADILSDSHSSDMESDDIYHVTDDDEGFEGVNPGCDFDDEGDENNVNNNNNNNLNNNVNNLNNNVNNLNNNVNNLNNTNFNNFNSNNNNNSTNNVNSSYPNNIEVNLTRMNNIENKDIASSDKNDSLNVNLN